MAVHITYTMDCDCGGVYESKVLDLTNHVEDADFTPKITISMELFGEETWDCNQCGDSIYVPAISDFAEDV